MSLINALLLLIDRLAVLPLPISPDPIHRTGIAGDCYPCNHSLNQEVYLNESKHMSFKNYDLIVALL